MTGTLAAEEDQLLAELSGEIRRTALAGMTVLSFMGLAIMSFIPALFVAAGVPRPRPSPTFRPTDCITDTSAGLHTFLCSGHNVTFSVPSDCAGSMHCGLIVDVHGLTMGSDIEDKNTGLRRLGESNDFIIVQPQACCGSGQCGGDCVGPPDTSWGSADDAIIEAVIEETVFAFAVDERAVHFTGFSQGGAMTWRFLRDHGSKFASFAPLAAGASLSAAGFAALPSRRPTLFVAGTTDGFVSFAAMAATRDNLVKLPAHRHLPLRRLRVTTHPPLDVFFTASFASTRCAACVGGGMGAGRADGGGGGRGFHLESLVRAPHVAAYIRADLS